MNCWDSNSIYNVREQVYVQGRKPTWTDTYGPFFEHLFRSDGDEWGAFRVCGPHQIWSLNWPLYGTSHRFWLVRQCCCCCWLLQWCGDRVYLWFRVDTTFPASCPCGMVDRLATLSLSLIIYLICIIIIVVITGTCLVVCTTEMHSIPYQCLDKRCCARR